MDMQTVRHFKDKKWYLLLLKASWRFVLLVCIVETVILLLKKLTGTASNTWEYIWMYIVRPGLTHVAIMLLVQWVSRLLVDRNEYVKQTYVYLTGMICICINIAWVHRSVQIIPAILVFPVLLSLVYVGKRPLRYAQLMGFASYGLYLLALYLLAGDRFPHFMEICTMLGLLVVAGSISRLVLARQTELVNSVIEMNKLSMTDSLTKLYNHASFYEQLDQHILATADTEETFCMIMFDIDDFKKINDQYGHGGGDEILLALVDAINACICGDDMAFRYGGEEFTVLTKRSPQESIALSEAIRASFTTRAAALQEGLVATASAGVSEYRPERFSGRREFFASADEAMYEAKRTGKNKTVLWSEKLLRQGDA